MFTKMQLLFPFPLEDFWGSNIFFEELMKFAMGFPSPLEDFWGSNRLEKMVVKLLISFRPLSRILGGLTAYLV